ncbi:CPBP family intramembrane glutamic endopeptidase [Haloarcula onubensis]|uniref:CPBP family intramembrane metalloprotease n=1 Tax=Haloarcula onubensis TaxID=2950539 RepID=A0ABU2FQC6_9EURY|nr:CPBP family intramembrane glutamic endopeptidase [Halomicroarcula sp. S3CR25-11]MDS0282396.1 CPBP family intramembrane metalloprotease [Halomicroarcula sp. S3CR25-11]
MSPNSTANRTVPTLRRAWQWLVWPVWNRDQRRLRAPLRAVAPLVCSFLALALLQPAIRAQFDHPVVEAVEALALAAVLVGTVLGSARLLDRRPVADYGLSLDRQWWRSFAVGGAVATALHAGALAVAVAAGWATITGVAGGAGALPFPAAMAVVFAYVAVAASWEEFIFRGAMLSNLAEGADGYVPRWAAAAVAVCCSSAVFAALHAGKITDPAQYGYYLLAGLVLGGVYALTGDLALPMGFHVWYNYAMSAVFGLGVSQRTPELLVVDLVGPTRWVGETGLLHVGFAAVGGVALLAYVRWRDGPLRVADDVTRWTGGGAKSEDTGT